MDCLATNGRFKPGGQRSKNGPSGLIVFPRNDIARHVIVVANHAIPVAYSRDRCSQPLKRNTAT